MRPPLDLPAPVHRRFERLLLAFLLLTSLPLARPTTGDDGARPDEVELGRRLFVDDRFSSSRGDFDTSCLSCHMVTEDPQGPRAHADRLARSWFPWRGADPRREHPRNTPTLFDARRAEALHFDGEFRSMEGLVLGTLLGRPLGWLPGEEEEAGRHLTGVLAADSEYRRRYRQVYDIDLATAPQELVLERTAEALTAYLDTLESSRTSSWDRFVARNRLPATPSPEESPVHFGRRLAALIEQRRARGELEISEDFGELELAGLRIFLRTDSAEDRSAGNCVTCHPPPLFTDFRFHNVGVSQEEYDGLHGAGSFAALELPAELAARRPVERLRLAPRGGHPGEVDLGYWNFAPDDGTEPGLERWIASFKTPTLRNLRFTDPYLHNGRYATLERTLRAKAAWADEARAGKLRAASPALLAMKLDEAAIKPLVAFLSSLDDDRLLPP